MASCFQGARNCCVGTVKSSGNAAKTVAKSGATAGSSAITGAYGMVTDAFTGDVEGQEFVYVHLENAQGLKPNPDDPESDPFVSVSCQDDTKTTSAKKDTQDPKWDEELVLKGNAGDTLKISVQDSALIRFKKVPALGYAEIEVPPMGQQNVIAKWIDLGPEPRKRRSPKSKSSASNQADAEDRGKLFLRVTRGLSRNPPPEFGLRPGARPKIANLKVQVHSGSSLPVMDVGSDSDPFVKLRLEDFVRYTPYKTNTLNPTWEANEATFDFDVTEISSNLILTVYDWDQNSAADPMGSVVVPLSKLIDRMNAGKVIFGRTLTATYGPESIKLLKPLKGSQSQHEIRQRPSHNLGYLKVSLTLESEHSTLHSYMVPRVLPHSSAEMNAKEDATTFSISKFKSSVGGLIDSLMNYLAGTVRVILYLQMWSEPKLNILLLILLLVSSLGFPRVCYFCSPLIGSFLIGVWGYVSHQIAQKSPTYMWKDQLEKLKEKRRRQKKEENQQQQREQEISKEMQEDANKGGKQSGKEDSAGGFNALQVFNLWKMLTGKLAVIQGKIDSVSSHIQRVANLVCFLDRQCSIVAHLVLILVGVGLSVAHTCMYFAYNYLNPIHMNHLCLVLGLFCLFPVPTTSRRALDVLSDALDKIPGGIPTSELDLGMEKSRKYAAKPPTEEEIREQQQKQLNKQAEKRRKAEMQRKSTAIGSIYSPNNAMHLALRSPDNHEALGMKISEYTMPQDGKAHTDKDSEQMRKKKYKNLASSGAKLASGGAAWASGNVSRAAGGVGKAAGGVGKAAGGFTKQSGKLLSGGARKREESRESANGANGESNTTETGSQVEANGTSPAGKSTASTASA